MAELPDISFMIITKRNWETNGKLVVDSIYTIDNPRNFTFEILVSSPNSIDDPRVKHFIDEPDSELGVGGDGQFNHLAKKTLGRYFATTPDYNLLPANYFSLIDFLESDIFTNRKYKITSPATNKQNIYPHPELTPSYPDALNKTSFYICLPDFRVICYPVMTRETYEKLGYFFHPQLCHGADWWLSFWLTEQGEEPLHLESVFFEHVNNTEERRKEKKFDKIIQNWRDENRFGESYINLYRIMKEYTKGDHYVCIKSKHLSEEEILALYYQDTKPPEESIEHNPTSP